MEILLYLTIGLIGLGFVFLLIEFPYHLMGLFIFIVLYDYNHDLPGPLDLRGILTVAFFFRLIVFDKENLNLILSQLVKNPLFLSILFFGMYFVTTTFINTNSFLGSIKEEIFLMISLLLGFLTVTKGHTQKAFFSAIIFSGIFSTGDLVYSYLTTSGSFDNTRILDVLTKKEYNAFLNHNVMGMLIGIGIVTTFMLFITKQINKILSFTLFIILGVGLLISTSRGTLLAVIVALILGVLTLPKELVDYRKLFALAFKSVLFLIIILGGYLFFIKAINLDSKFSDKIYYRLVEEPMSIFEGKNKDFTASGHIKEGTIEWRMLQAQRDLKIFSNQPLSTQLLGYGEGGYFKIAKKEYTPGGKLNQYASHNGYVLMIIEGGIIGFILMVLLFIYIIVTTFKTFRKDYQVFPFFAIIIFFLVFSYGAQTQLLGKFAYVIFGGIIAESIFAKDNLDEEEDDDEE